MAKNHKAKETPEVEQTPVVETKTAWNPKTFWTQEKRDQMRATMKAKYADEGLREKLSESMTAYWAEHDHPMKGRTFTAEQKEHMREGQRRYRASLATPVDQES